MIERHDSKSAARVVQPEGAGQAENRLHTGIQTCEVCGNDYDKPLEIVKNGISHYFDSFECAISALALTCGHCKCRIIGHGVESGGTYFCCVHCAAQSGVKN